MKDYSQHGESLVLEELFEKIGLINSYGVEFGASDGYWLSNLRFFLEAKQWAGLQMEGVKHPINGVVNEFITAENINSLFQKHNVPERFDLLSIDIDGNDYWVWREIKSIPSVVVIEYNSNFDVDTDLVLEYNPNNSFDGSYAYSASAKALCRLSETKGYYLYDELGYCNLIFVKSEYAPVAPPKVTLDTLRDRLPYYQHGRNLGNKRFICSP